MYRVLSLDGGGIKGAFTASFLATAEEMIGDQVGRYFDLIVGTSTGGIIALGLGAGMSTKEILAFYEEDGPNIFPRTPWWMLHKKIGRIFKPKYTHDQLEAALKRRFGDRRIGDSVTRLVIPTFDIERDDIHLFKTAHHERLQQDYKDSMVTAALATAAAPTFFPTYQTPTGTPLVDGGMWANNPVLVAAMEATSILNWKREQVSILSIGCTVAPLDLGDARRFGKGLGYWATRAPDAFLAGQSRGALAMACHHLGKDQIVRVNPVVPSGRYDLDKIAELSSLISLGRSTARHEVNGLKTKFFSKRADVFHPVYGLPKAPLTMALPEAEATLDLVR